MATKSTYLSSERQVVMKWLYFFLMRLFESKPESKCYMWAYRKCLNAYVDEDPDYGYFRFANDYFKTLTDYTDPGLR